VAPAAAIGDAALIEDLEGAGVQSAGARLDQLLVRAPLDHNDVDIGERELRSQHQTSWASAGDHHGMIGHGGGPRAGAMHMLV